MDILGLPLTGRVAWWIYRTTYVLKLVGLQNKIRVVVTLLLNPLFERDITADVVNDTRCGEQGGAGSRERFELVSLATDDPRSPLPAPCSLVVLKSGNRIHFRCARRRNVTGKQRHGTQHHGRGNERDRIAGRHPVELARHYAG